MSNVLEDSLFVSQNKKFDEIQSIVRQFSAEYIHILFEAPPQVQLSKLANNYKTVTSRLIRKNFSEQLKPYYWKPYFWSDSYFVCSVSDRTESAVKSYIDSQ